MMTKPNRPNPPLSPEQQLLNDLWEEHIRDEFTTHDTDAILSTMVPDAYVDHIPRFETDHLAAYCKTTMLMSSAAAPGNTWVATAFSMPSRIAIGSSPW